MERGFEMTPDMRRRLERLRPLLSPERYAELREKVRERGPEYLREEEKKREALAEIRLLSQMNPEKLEGLRGEILMDLEKRGVDTILDVSSFSPEARKALTEGKFHLGIEAHPSSKEDQLVIVPEGRVSESLPLKPLLSDQYLSQFRMQRGSS